EAARAAGAQLVVFGELAVTGYPPEDLLFNRTFLEASAAAVNRIAERCVGIVALVGFPELADETTTHNALALLADRQIQGIYHKLRLPNYGVFDEQRYFRAGQTEMLLTLNGHRIGMTICEDIWRPGRPASTLAQAGATLLVNSSASPYH